MYQGISRGNLREIVDRLHDLMILRDPDITLLIDMDPEIGLSRAKARSTKEERFEDFGLQLQQTMREGFLTLAKEYSDRFRVIDGHGDADQIAEKIYAQIIGLIR